MVRRKGLPRYERIVVYLEPDLADWVRRAAESNELSDSGCVAAMLRRYRQQFAARQTPQERTDAGER